MALADYSVAIFASLCKKSNIKLNKVKVRWKLKKRQLPVVTGVTMKVNVSAKARKALLKSAWRRT
jgi:hypothetical protein